METLTPEQLANLKVIIKEQISTNPVFVTLKEKLKQEIDSKSFDKDTILAKIKETGLMPELIKALDNSKLNQELKIKQESKNVPAKTKKLIVCIDKGSDFTCFENTAGKLMVSVCCFGQIRRTKSVDCCAKPQFNEIFSFEISNEEKHLLLKQLINLSEPLHIVLLKTDNGKNEIIAAQKMEWRRVLVNGVVEERIEMNGQNFRMNGAIGNIKVL